MTTGAGAGGGAGGGGSRPLVMILLLIAALGLLASVSIRDRVALLGDGGDGAPGRGMLRLGGARPTCARRVVMCGVPPDDHAGRPSTCQEVSTLEEKEEEDGESQSAARDVFSVRVCEAGERDGGLVVRVLHHTQQQPCGAYIEAALLDGPERRLQRLEHSGGDDGDGGGGEAVCEYSAALSGATPGAYRLEVSVVHTEEVASAAAVAGILAPFRNYVLWSGRRVFSTSRSRSWGWRRQEQKQQEGQMGKGGRWVRRRSSVDVESDEAEEMEGYRCPSAAGGGSFEWVEHGCKGRELDAEGAQACVRRLPPIANATHPKLVLLGDSFSRQTFNGLARVLGMDEVMAIKAFKSMKAAQEWGGPAEGMELSFQWAPLPQAAESRRRLKTLLLEDRAHVLVNFGAHPLCQGPLNQTLALFDDWLAFVQEEVLAADEGARRRLAWLGQHPLPVAGFHRHHQDHATNLRSLGRTDAMNRYTRERLRQAGVRVLGVFDVVNPFRDCTADGTHHGAGVPEAVARHRVLPWVCGLAEDGGE